MNKQERHTLKRMVENTAEISITGSTCEFNDGVFTRKEVRSPEEVDRLFDSDDFKLGWRMCHDRVRETVEFITAATNDDLIKYAGRPRKEVKEKS